MKSSPRGLAPALAVLAISVLVWAGCGGSPRTPRRLPAATAAPPESPASLPPLRGPGGPNIIFVLTDDLSTDLLRYMPHVRELARRGTSFSRYVVSDSLCCPSRASILTGRLPHNTGVFTNVAPDGGFRGFMHHDNERRTFAVAMRDRGYRTGLFGKYLNGYHADRPGVPRGWADWGAGSYAYRGFDYNLNENGSRVFYGQSPRAYVTDVLSRLGTSFVDRAAQEDRPFMLELATFAPHRPAVPAPRDRALFPAARAPRGPSFNRRDVEAPRWLAHRRRRHAPVVARIDRRYRDRAQSVVAVDELVAALQRRLRATGLAARTYFVFSSDNGYHMGQHRLLPGKMTAFDSDIRVPLIVTGPGVSRGARVRALAQNTDLAPTFERLAGARPQRGVDGRSLLPLLRGRTPRDWRRAALIEHHHPDRSRLDPDLQSKASGDPPSYEAMRTRTATYVEYVDGEREYYDNRRDPAQLRNRYPQLGARRRKRLHRRLLALTLCSGADCSRRAPPARPRRRRSGRPPPSS